MSNLILNQKDMFRAERLFSERIAGPISTQTFNQTESGHNRSISRLIDDTKKYRIVRI
jgi:hypothetical protein